MLGDPGSPPVIQRAEEEGIGDAMLAKIRNAHTLYRPLLAVPNVEIRLRQRVLYNSIYRADGELIVNQHVYGIPTAHAPVLCFHQSVSGDMIAAYLASFEKVWAAAEPIQRGQWGGTRSVMRS